jgi:hypothetical protein
MTQSSVGAFLIVRPKNSAQATLQVQNFKPDTTIDGHTFYPFNVTSITSTRTAAKEDMSIELALSGQVLDILLSGLHGGHIVQLTLKTIDDATTASVKAGTLLANFLGEVVGLSYNEVMIDLSVGSVLDPVEAQAPPRKFTTSLIGTPPQL